MEEVLPGSYIVEVTPAPALDGISQPTKVLAFDMVLCTSTDVPEHVVYEGVKALHQNKAALAATFGAFNLLRARPHGQAGEGRASSIPAR